MPTYNLGSGNNDFDSANAVPPFADGSIVNAGSGNDTIDAVGDDLLLNGGSGDDVVNADGDDNTLIGGSGDDTASGGFGADSISGGSGRDDLSGNDGNDDISGGSGNDVIRGGDDEGDDAIVFSGSTLVSFTLGDVLTGGSGRDRFLFDGDDDDHDLITDFSVGVDTLEISDVASVTQVVIEDGVFGPGLLIITDADDDGLFLQGVDAPLGAGDLVFV